MAATEFNLGKSTIHKDMSEKLKEIDIDLFLEVQKLMKEHIKERHIKGGEKTKSKYTALRK